MKIQLLEFPVIFLAAVLGIAVIACVVAISIPYFLGAVAKELANMAD